MQAMVSSAIRRDEQDLRDARFAMRLSLIFGLGMLIGKTTVYFMTHSAAIFSSRDQQRQAPMSWLSNQFSDGRQSRK